MANLKSLPSHELYLDLSQELLPPLDVFYSSMRTIPDEVQVPASVTYGFAVLVLFFLGILVFELLSEEAIGVPAKKKDQPVKYWIVLVAQAGAGIFSVALLYFLTH